jgi:hypothetical protein
MTSRATPSAGEAGSRAAIACGRAQQRVGASGKAVVCMHAFGMTPPPAA